jgi:hypothetical protein
VLDPAVDAVVVGLAGFFIGGVTFVVSLLDPTYKEGRPPRPPPFRRGFFKALDEQQARERAARAAAPASYSVALSAFGGLIVVVVLLIVFSPVYMRWWYFIGGFFLGFLVLNGVYMLTATGRLQARRKSPALDRLFRLREHSKPTDTRVPRDTGST